MVQGHEGTCGGLPGLNTPFLLRLEVNKVENYPLVSEDTITGKE